MRRYDAFFKSSKRFVPKPVDFSISEFSCYDFMESTRIFTENNFQGAINLDIGHSAPGKIKISPRGFAYFFRVLLTETYGESLVFVKIDSTEDELFVEVAAEGTLKISDTIKEAAKLSGFSVKFKKDSIALSTPIIKPEELVLASIPAIIFINYYVEVFLMQENA